MEKQTDSNLKTISKTPLDVLRDAFKARKDKNQAYSLNSFARDLGISKSLLSRVLSGDRAMTMKLAIQVSAALDLKEAESKRLLLTVLQASSKNAKISKKLRASLEKELESDEPEDSSPLFTTVEIERFKAMASWHHVAILNLTTVKGFKSEPAWIAKYLGISTFEAQEAIDRLFAVGLLIEREGKIKRSTGALHVKTNKSEYAVRKFHEQMMMKAQDNLKETSEKAFEARLINGITFAIGRDQIALVKEKIDKFQDEILSLSTAGEKEELYQLNMQFFPLSNNKGDL